MNKYVKYGLIGFATLITISVAIKYKKKEKEPIIDKEMEDLINRIDKAKK
jgi:hypothetical protein